VRFDDKKRSLFTQKKEITTDNLLPWIIDAQQFVEQCTQCADCISVCPENILFKGDGGFPNIDFNLGECDFCGKCADVCKEPIFSATIETPWHNKALITQACLAHESIYCRSCAESCEVQALTFQLGISAVPMIDLELCTGCGACVAPCPTKAIEIKELK